VLEISRSGKTLVPCHLIRGSLISGLRITGHLCKLREQNEPDIEGGLRARFLNHHKSFFLGVLLRRITWRSFPATPRHIPIRTLNRRHPNCLRAEDLLIEEGDRYGDF
jgi:hypothetical protein